MLFVAFIMHGAILGEGSEFLGFIDHRSIVSLLVFFCAITYNLSFVPKKQLDYLKKLILFLAIFLLLFTARYIEIKNGMLFGGLDFATQLKRLFRDSIYIYAFYLIVEKMYNIDTLRGLENGLLLGVAIGVTSMLFYDSFLSLGFTMHMGDSALKGQYLRLSGFFGDNSNNTAGFLNVVVGYVFARNERTKKFSIKHIILLGLAIIGILHLASRAGLVVLLVLTLLFVIRTSVSLKIAIRKSIIIFIMCGFLFYNFGDYMIERAAKTITGEMVGIEARQGYWKLYLNDLMKNPEYLIIGNLGKATYYRDVHNTYIQYLFYTGLIPFLVIIYLFGKIYSSRNRYKANYYYFTPLYTLLALMISWITGAGTINYWFLLIIAASAGIPARYASLLSKKVKVQI